MTNEIGLVILKKYVKKTAKIEFIFYYIGQILIY